MTTTPDSPVIGVIGLTPSQEGEIAKAFPEMDLRFWGIDYGWDRLSSIANRAHITFVHVRHVNHKVTSVLKTGTTRLVSVRGGVSSLKTAITDWRNTCAT